MGRMITRMFGREFPAKQLRSVYRSMDTDKTAELHKYTDVRTGHVDDPMIQYCINYLVAGKCIHKDPSEHPDFKETDKGTPHVFADFELGYDEAINGKTRLKTRSEESDTDGSETDRSEVEEKEDVVGMAEPTEAKTARVDATGTSEDHIAIADDEDAPAPGPSAPSTLRFCNDCKAWIPLPPHLTCCPTCCPPATCTRQHTFAGGMLSPLDADARKETGTRRICRVHGWVWLLENETCCSRCCRPESCGGAHFVSGFMLYPAVVREWRPNDLTAKRPLEDERDSFPQQSAKKTKK